MSLIYTVCIWFGICFSSFAKGVAKTILLKREAGSGATDILLPEPTQEGTHINPSPSILETVPHGVIKFTFIV